MNRISQLLFVLLAMTCSLLAVKVLWGYYPDGGVGDTIVSSDGGIKVIWSIVGAHCFVAAFFWAKLFASIWKSLFVGGAVWVWFLAVIQ